MTVERHEADWAVSLDGGNHAICPVCRFRSHSRHSSYRRTLRDLPAQGAPIEVRARLTRWRCRNDRCKRRIFTERIPGLAAPFARRTTRLAGIVRLIGHSAGGRPSERLLAPWHARGSRDHSERGKTKRANRRERGAGQGGGHR
ncbi:MAG: hypothetical protein CTY36_01915 [Methylocystis sp.]|nr:MAG: hypothetical protein CTY36_01915 [Methylocystis sp.]